MLPASLVSSYQEYKRDTDAIATWLASTAKSCGYKIVHQAAEPSNTGKGRLKGKARAEAKKQQEATKSADKHIIKISDFVPLAEFVASKNICIPNSLITTLRRVITARGGFANKLSERGVNRDKASDENHGYFVGILDQVEKILNRRTRPGPTPVSTKPDNKPTATPSDYASNQFAGLEVYEPSEEFLEAPAFETPNKSRDECVDYEAEQLASFDAVIVYTWLLVKDLQNIRARVKWIWARYRAGLFDLCAAAIAANTAIDLARNLSKSIRPW